MYHIFIISNADVQLLSVNLDKYRVRKIQIKKSVHRVGTESKAIKCKCK